MGVNSQQVMFELWSNKNMTVLWLIVGLGQWFLLFLHILPFNQTRSPDLPQYTQMVLIYWKYEHNKLLQFRIIYKKITLAAIYGAINLHPRKMNSTPGYG